MTKWWLWLQLHLNSKVKFNRAPGGLTFALAGRYVTAMRLPSLQVISRASENSGMLLVVAGVVRGFDAGNAASAYGLTGIGLALILCASIITAYYED